MANVDLLDHNPDSNCVACCANSERLNNLVIEAEPLIVRLKEIVALMSNEQVEKMSPMLKLIGKLGVLGG